MNKTTIDTSAYHVYADDGFESSHRSLAAAETAARRGSRRRPGVEYSVVQTTRGYTGGGHGRELTRYLRGGVQRLPRPRS